MFGASFLLAILFAFFSVIAAAELGLTDDVKVSLLFTFGGKGIIRLATDVDDNIVFTPNNLVETCYDTFDDKFTNSSATKYDLIYERHEWSVIFPFKNSPTTFILHRNGRYVSDAGDHCGFVFSSDPTSAALMKADHNNYYMFAGESYGDSAKTRYFTLTGVHTIVSDDVWEEATRQSRELALLTKLNLISSRIMGEQTAMYRLYQR